MRARTCRDPEVRRSPIEHAHEYELLEVDRVPAAERTEPARLFREVERAQVDVVAAHLAVLRAEEVAVRAARVERARTRVAAAAVGLVLLVPHRIEARRDA